MAGRQLVFNTPIGTPVAISSTRKTAVQVQAPSNFNVRVRRVTVTLDGQSATDAKVYVAITRQTAKTDSGTAMTAQLVDDNGGTAQTTARYNYTAEPTDDSNGLLHECLVHPQGGIAWSPSVPTYIPAGGALGIEIEDSDSGTHNATVTVEVEE